MTCIEPGLGKALADRILCRSGAGCGENGGKHEDKRIYERCGSANHNRDIFNGIVPLLCTADGECNYLLMWFLIGTAVGIGHMYLWIIPKGYDLGGTMGILCVNLLIAGVIGGVILTGRLLKASMYLAKAMAAGITWIVKIVCKGVRA